MQAMSTAALARSEKPPRRNARSTYAITTAQDTLLGALADALFEGNRSAAIGHLIDVHAGREIERAKLEEQERERPSLEIVRVGKARLSKELIGTIGGAIMAGLSTPSALELAGVTEAQWRTWRQKGKKDRGDGKESLHADLVTWILRAEAEQKAENIAAIRKHRDKTWTSAAWLLERMYPDEFGERKRIDGKVQHSFNPLIDYDRLTPSEIKTLVALLRKASPERDDPAVSRSSRPAIELVPEEVLEIEEADWTEAPALEAPALDTSEAPGLDVEAPALEKPQH
jgi:hypothetical protein